MTELENHHLVTPAWFRQRQQWRRRSERLRGLGPEGWRPPRPSAAALPPPRGLRTRRHTVRQEARKPTEAFATTPGRKGPRIGTLAAQENETSVFQPGCGRTEKGRGLRTRQTGRRTRTKFNARERNLTRGPCLDPASNNLTVKTHFWGTGKCEEGLHIR